MEFLHEKIHIGAEKPFSVLHVSDTHLCFADSRDNERKNELAARRTLGFPGAEQNAEETVAFACRNSMPVIHTGDLIDFVSAANLEKAAEFSKSCDCFMSAGNHEFSQYVGEAKEDAAYREQSLGAVQACFRNDIRFSSRIINGVDFIALDNSYYLIDEPQLAALKKELSKNVPTVLCVHTPLFNEEIYRFKRESDPDEPAYLMCVPFEKMAYYSPERFSQQAADETTKEAFDLIVGSDCIKCILAGHIHNNFKTYLRDDLVQIVTGIGTGRVIEFI